ncbi:hypothetical protein SAMN05444143_101254 [Flavobacterium succinicans]|uniref:Uncharacterized protein n=1 Tax=Flavobacterium succinicans TaxID=29536 RepID=A0A1I4R982_9FLAO|nr:hypothetical protein SAMN05444143_101254 [Flavobacterium succinicans]
MLLPRFFLDFNFLKPLLSQKLYNKKQIKFSQKIAKKEGKL